MLFEELLVRVLNRQRRPSKGSAQGLFLGQAEALIGGERRPCLLPVRPILHSFVVGRTGSGKTTLLLRLMAEHLRAGVSFVFVDFHGPATDDLLAQIAAGGAKRQVVLLEPSSDPVIGWNPLETAGESPYATVQELITVFHRRLWPDAWGPRLEELLRMTLLTLAEAKLTLLEATRFLSHPEFRRAVLRKATIPEVREFWSLRFERLSPSQRSLVTETVLNKLSVFHDPSIKYVVGQNEGTLDFDKALAEGYTILANLSSGRLRGNNFLLAALLVAKLKAAVYHRPQGAKPYAIFLDEFQEMIALEALDDYLRSFRKFGCPVYLATQHLELPSELKAAIFGNCGRFFAFATSVADATFLGREFGPPEGALAAELLPELPTGTAILKARGHAASRLNVLPVSHRPTPDQLAAGRAQCQRLGQSREKLDAELEARLRTLASSAGEPQSGSRSSTDHLGSSDLPEGYGNF